MTIADEFPFIVLLQHDFPDGPSEEPVAFFHDKRDAAAFVAMRNVNNIAYGGKYVAVEHTTRRLVSDPASDRQQIEIKGGHLGHGARLLDILARHDAT